MKILARFFGDKGKKIGVVRVSSGGTGAWLECSSVVTARGLAEKFTLELPNYFWVDSNPVRHCPRIFFCLQLEKLISKKEKP
jgi:hypothetical protein